MRRGFSRVDDGQRLLDVEMRRVRREPQGVEDQGVEPFEHRPALVGDAGHVGAVREVAEPEAQDAESAVLQADRQHALAQHGERLAGRDPLEPQPGQAADRDVVRGLVEGVGERLADHLLGLRLAIERDRAADRPGEQPGVVQAEEVVGVVMGVEDRVDLADPLAQELEPHLGRGVDQQVPAGKLQQDARPGALVAWVVRAADRRSRIRSWGRPWRCRSPGRSASENARPRSPPPGAPADVRDDCTRSGPEIEVTSDGSESLTQSERCERMQEAVLISRVLCGSALCVNSVHFAIILSERWVGRASGVDTIPARDDPQPDGAGTRARCR